MKKTLASVMIAGAMAASLTLFGCGGQPAATEKKAETTEQTQTKTDTAQTNTTKTETKSGNQTAAGQISQEDAKRIALEDAGVKEADVTGSVRVMQDTDDGVPSYDVDFLVGTTEYEYDIDATSGVILKVKSTTEDQGSAGQVSQEDAKRIALEDAGVNEADVTGYVKVELDTDNGVTKYDVGFHVGTTEYDYDIDATTGAILSRGSEIDIDD